MEKLLVVGVDTTIGANLALACADTFEVLGMASAPAWRSTVSTAAPPPPVMRTTWSTSPPAFVPTGSCTPARSRPRPGICRPAIRPGRKSCRWCVGCWSARSKATCLTVLLTDAVFAGPRMFHDEAAPTASIHPAAPYALALEQLLADDRAGGRRMPMAGPRPAANRAWPMIYQGLSSGARVMPDGRRYATPILASDLATLLRGPGT